MALSHLLINKRKNFSWNIHVKDRELDRCVHTRQPTSKMTFIMCQKNLMHPTLPRIITQKKSKLAKLDTILTWKRQKKPFRRVPSKFRSTVLKNMLAVNGWILKLRPKPQRKYKKSTFVQWILTHTIITNAPTPNQRQRGACEDLNKVSRKLWTIISLAWCLTAAESWLRTTRSNLSQLDDKISIYTSRTIDCVGWRILKAKRATDFNIETEAARIMIIEICNN